MTEFKTIIRKSDEQYMQPIGDMLYVSDYPYRISEPNIDLIWSHHSFRNSYDIDDYALVEVAVIRTDKIPTDEEITPAELQAVITLITLNETECVYAHPLLKSAKEKLERIMK